MTKTTTDIYLSENGDRWQLIRDDVSGRAVVRHDANPSSGGQRSEIDAEEFLKRAGSGPEYAALRSLLDEQKAARE